MSRTALKPLFASVAVAIGLFAAVPSADAYIYWTSSDGSIGRAENNGSSPNNNFISGIGSSYSIAVDSGHVYWTDFLEAGSAIGRANIDGSSINREYIYTGTLGSPVGLAVDSSHLYWAGWQSNAIGRVGLDGNDLVTNWIQGSSDLFGSGSVQTAGVAVNAERIYWGNWRAGLSGALGSIGTAEISGANPDNSYVPMTSGVDSLALTPNYLFWSNYGSSEVGSIGRVDLQTAVADDSFISDIKTPDGVATDGTHIFWTNRTDGAIGRANIDGTGVNQTFLPNAGSPYGIAVDSLSSPTIVAVKLARRFATVRVGCGLAAGGCTVTLTGKKVGTSALMRSKTVTVAGSSQVTTTISYTPKLIKALRKGGRVTIKAAKSAGEQKSLTGRVR